MTVSTFDYKIALRIQIADREGAIHEGLSAESQLRGRAVIQHLRLAAETPPDRLPALWKFWNETNFGHDGLNYAAAEATAVLEYVLDEIA
jgi:hypothetical protein